MVKRSHPVPMEDLDKFVLRAHFRNGNDVWHRLLEREPLSDRSAEWRASLKDRDRLIGQGAYAVQMDGWGRKEVVMEWSIDGPVAEGDYRWILFGPWEKAADAQAMLDSFDGDLCVRKKSEIYTVRDHIYQWNGLWNRRYTDG